MRDGLDGVLLGEYACVVLCGSSDECVELLRGRMKLVLDVLSFVWTFFQIPQEVGLNLVATWGFRIEEGS